MSNRDLGEEYVGEDSFNLDETSGKVTFQPPSSVYSPVEISGISSEDVSIEDIQPTKFDNIEQSQISEQYQMLPSNANAFIYDNGTVHYNIARGVDYKAPLLVGSKTLTGEKGCKGYHPSHMVFDPTTATLAAGYDIDNNWAKTGNFCIISGIGNSSHLDASIVTGSNNHIVKLEQDPDELNCQAPPSCCILGGSNNFIANNSACQKTSAIVGCKDMSVKNCETTVFVGMKGRQEDGPFENLDETVVMRNAIILDTVKLGPVSTNIPEGTRLISTGNIIVEGSIDSQQINTKYLVADEAYIKSANITRTDLYLQGDNQASGKVVVINPTDNVDIVYANPINGVLNIYLGTPTNNTFPTNKEITFKDVTLEYAAASSHNVNIIVPNIEGEGATRIEYYDGGYKVGTNSGYALNSSGGSVTFVFTRTPNSLPTWIIKNQFIGNPRILGSSGIKFIPCKDNTKTRIITK